ATNTTYYWSVNASDGSDWSNITYHFTTLRCPYIILVSPANQSTEIPLTPTIQIWAQDYCSLGLNIFFYENSTGSWTQRQSNISSLANSSINWTFSQATSYNTTYYYNISVNNGLCNTTYIFYFKTKSSSAPTFSFEVPTNNSYGVDKHTTQLNITIEDPDGDIFNYSWFFSCGVSNFAIDNTNGSKIFDLSGCGGLDYCTQYYWQVNVTDGENETNATYYFTTENMSNQTFINPNPANGSLGQELSFIWNITIENTDGEYFDWWINVTNGDNNSNTSASNGSKNVSISGLAYSTTYTVWVNATNNCSNWTI
ncbi:unnamed protein product, partial [marine sediment metagenome]